MGISIETVGFCPQYFSSWKVTGSRGDVYEVIIAGAESMPHCTCPAFTFSKDAPWGKECKHIKAVWEHGCLYNPQWRDPGPNDYAQHGMELGDHYFMRQVPDYPCPGCGADMILVRIAV